MQRWRISESNLPPGSEIYFREPTAWENIVCRFGDTPAATLAIPAGSPPAVPKLAPVPSIRSQSHRQSSRATSRPLVHPDALTLPWW